MRCGLPHVSGESKQHKGTASEGDPSNGRLVKDFQKVMQSMARDAGVSEMKRQVNKVAPHIDGDQNVNQKRKEKKRKPPHGIDQKWFNKKWLYYKSPSGVYNR